MRLALKLLVLFSLADLWCGTGLYFTHGELVSSTTKFHGFVTLDLAAGLSKYIQHETKRLEIIKTAKGYEDEVPLVKIRLQELQSLRQQMSAAAGKGTGDDSWARNQHAANDFHPTTALRLITRFLDTWDSKLKNDTLYGFRFAEFLSNDDHTKLPTETDRQLAARALVEIQYVYNLSTSHLYAGQVMGHQGMPLRPEDAYQVAMAASSLQHVEQAVQWYETALNHTSPEELAVNNVNNASYPVPTAMATLGVLKYGMDKKAEGLELLEKASDLDPDDQDILRQFLSHRTGRDVLDLVHSDPGELRKHWFQLCANASSTVVKRMRWYHVCRYKQARGVPYRRYREEVLSRTPYLSILHGVLSPAEAGRLVNVSATKLVDGAVIDGLGSDLVLVEGAVLNHTVEAARLLSARIADVTGLDTAQGPVNPSGEPLHVFNYGMSGSFLPHYDINRVYKSRHIMRRSGHRMASVLIYLSEVKAGGATAFPYLNLTVEPQVGKALLWYNTDPSGKAERDIIHAGCTVAVGAKWVASKGIWSWGNELRRPCGPKMTSSHMAVDKISTRSPTKSKPKM